MSQLTVDCQISWVYTDDLVGTCAFYESGLGLKQVRDEGSARIFRVSSTASIGVCLAFDDRVIEPKGGMISFITDDVDGWYAQLLSKGVSVHSPPHRLAAFNIYTFFVEDPNGYLIEFQQFLNSQPTND